MSCTDHATVEGPCKVVGGHVQSINDIRRVVAE